MGLNGSIILLKLKIDNDQLTAIREKARTVKFTFTGECYEYTTQEQDTLYYDLPDVEGVYVFSADNDIFSSHQTVKKLNL